MGVTLAALAMSLVLWRTAPVALHPGAVPPPGLVAAIVLALSLTSFALWRWTRAVLWRVISPGLLVAGTMILAAGAYQQWLVIP